MAHLQTAVRLVVVVVSSLLFAPACSDSAGDPPRPEAVDAELDASNDLSDDAADPSELDAEADAPSDPSDPLEIALTVDGLPAEMNGSTDIYVLTLPTEGFTVDLTFTGGARPIDLETLDVTVGGASLGSALEASENGVRVFAVEADGFEPADDVPVCASARDQGVRVEAPCLTVNLGVREPALDPFPEAETWLIVTRRDQFTPSPQMQFEPPVLLSAEAPDGVADLDQALDAFGLTSGGGNPEQDALTRQRLVELVRAKTGRIFNLGTSDPVPIVLVFDDDPGAPDPADFAPDGGFSMIALGGDMPEALQNAESTVGRAMIDWNNQVRNDDTLLNLGIFVTSIVRQAIVHPAGALVLQSFCPLLGGVPFGLGPHDASILPDGSPEPDSNAARLRLDMYELALDLLAVALSTTLAHEMGHSLGLVPPGLPPGGLCAGEDVPFVVQVMDNAHIDTVGLNVMQTGAVTNYLDALAEADRVAFNPLNLAYLRRRLLVIR